VEFGLYVAYAVVVVVIFVAWFLAGRVTRKDCPVCGRKRSVRFEKVHVYHPEEPPMFGQWVCCACDAYTPIVPTGLTIDVAKKFVREGRANDVVRSIAESGEASNEADQWPIVKE